MELQEAGYLPRSVLNFVALLGWHPGTQQEIFSREELIEEFDLSRLNKSSAVVDLEKLNWVQQQHIRWLADHDMETLFRLAEPFLVAALPQSLLQRQRLLSVMRLLKERILFIADVPRLVMPFFGDVEVPAVLRAELHGKFGEYDMGMFCRLYRCCRVGILLAKGDRRMRRLLGPPPSRQSVVLTWVLARSMGLVSDFRLLFFFSSVPIYHFWRCSLSESFAVHCAVGAGAVVHRVRFRGAEDVLQAAAPAVQACDAAFACVSDGHKCGSVAARDDGDAGALDGPGPSVDLCVSCCAAGSQ